MSNCIFCQIVKGEIPSYKVYEDNSYLAFLTIEPLREGHTLVIPKHHSDYLFDLDSIEITNLMNVCKQVANKLKAAFRPVSGKVGVLVIGDEVPHVHIHLIPFDNAADLALPHHYKVSPAELKLALAKIKS